MTRSGHRWYVLIVAAFTAAGATGGILAALLCLALAVMFCEAVIWTNDRRDDGRR
jgi:hypothetical protein